MSEPWPFRDAVLAALALKHEAFDCMEGTNADELKQQEDIERACVRFLRALADAAPDAFRASMAERA